MADEGSFVLSFPFRPLTRRTDGQQGGLPVEANTDITHMPSTPVNTRISLTF